MKTVYPLKKSEKTHMVEPLYKYLEMTQSPEFAKQYRDPFNKITQLRNRAVTLELETKPDIQTMDKYIKVLEMYCRFALMIAKHFNWNPQYGPTVQDLNLKWYDSCNPTMSYMKSQIHFDIFCCYYNLGILHFYKASNLCMTELDSSRKQSMRCAKNAYYYFNQMRTYYYQGFVNTGFSDTNYSHLELLECLCLGILYKNLFNTFKENIFKTGIEKVAHVAALAQINFFKSYQIATAFFMKSSSIPNSIKSELLSFSYVEALYHDVQANSMFAKHYENQMDNDKGNIVQLIAYQKKALRLLNLGLSNQSVTHLLDQRSQQKKQLMKMKPQLEASINKNLLRNQQIYKKQQISQDKIPLQQAPKQYLVSPKQPDSLLINYEGSIASLFIKLIDNQSKGFMNDLRQFSKNRVAGLESAYAKLQKNIQVIYNDCFVNYYLNLENNNKQKGIPENLKKKLQQISSNGGKQKIQLEINIIKNNSKQIGNRFNQLKQLLHDEESFDNQKRSKYGDRWKRPLSTVVNRSYVNQIQLYQKKALDADNVNSKILQKYKSLTKYIDVAGGTEDQIMLILPKVQITKFLQENKDDLIKLKEGTALVKQKIEGLQSLTDQIKKFFEKTDFADLANKHYREAKDGREAVLDKLFGKVYKLIESFNEKVKTLQLEAQKVGQIATQLNKKNKGDEANKKEFEEVMSKFTDVSTMFRELSQGTSFYTKLNDILARIYSDLQGFLGARKLEANDLEASINRGGGQGGPQLPSMYPNQKNNQNFGFYTPPPMNFNGFSNINGPNGYASNSGSSIDQLMGKFFVQKNDFDANIFGNAGTIYQSSYKR